jgi:hypothetical protein
MTLAFLWWWSKASITRPNWRDGLRAALEVIERNHTVDWYLDEDFPEDHYDAYLIWGDSYCPAIEKIKSYGGKKGICLSTDPVNIDNLRNLDVVFCESSVVYDEVRQQGLRAIQAFGTDTDFFKPKNNGKDIEYFYPATFSPWKRQSTIAHLGPKLHCVGTVQPDGEGELQVCRENDVSVEVGYFPVEKILDMYQNSMMVPIPAIHGSERTVLESMACGIVPEVNPANRKAFSYIKEMYDQKTNPREFVLSHYSSEGYAEKLLKGLT